MAKSTAPNPKTELLPKEILIETSSLYLDPEDETADQRVEAVLAAEDQLFRDRKVYDFTTIQAVFADKWSMWRSLRRFPMITDYIEKDNCLILWTVDENDPKEETAEATIVLIGDDASANIALMQAFTQYIIPRDVAPPSSINTKSYHIDEKESSYYAERNTVRNYLTALVLGRSHKARAYSSADYFIDLFDTADYPDYQPERLSLRSLESYFAEDNYFSDSNDSPLNRDKVSTVLNIENYFSEHAVVQDPTRIPGYAVANVKLNITESDPVTTAKEIKTTVEDVAYGVRHLSGVTWIIGYLVAKGQIRLSVFTTNSNLNFQTTLNAAIKYTRRLTAADTSRITYQHIRPGDVDTRNYATSILVEAFGHEQPPIGLTIARTTKGLVVPPMVSPSTDHLLSISEDTEQPN